MCSKNDTRQIAPYVTMKNMEMISATALMSPMSTNAKAMTHVAIDALTGSCSNPFPFSATHSSVQGKCRPLQWPATCEAPP